MALRHASSIRRAVPRIVLAAVLTLALLSGIIPFNALSASHECSMSCCLDKSPHASGSCSVSFASDEETATTDEPEHEQTAHRAHAGHVAQTHEGHQQTKESSTHRAASGKRRERNASVRSQALTKPCAPECAAAAASASTQTRRPRDHAAPAIAGKPRPLIIIFYASDFSNIWSLTAASHKLLPPRAPPVLLSNLSA